jgi:hypothetical protein
LRPGKSRNTCKTGIDTGEKLLSLLPFYSFAQVALQGGLVFLLPVPLILLALLAVDYFRDARAIREQIELSASQLGRVTLGSFRHAMLQNDAVTIAMMVREAAVQKPVKKVWIVDLNGMIRQSGAAEETVNKVNRTFA